MLQARAPVARAPLQPADARANAAVRCVALGGHDELRALATGAGGRPWRRPPTPQPPTVAEHDDVQGRLGSRRAGDDVQVVQVREQFLAWPQLSRCALQAIIAGASASPCSQPSAWQMSRQVTASSHQQYTVCCP